MNLNTMFSLASGYTLPDIIFFKPTPAFVNYVKKINRPVVDIGAGVGFMSKVLSESGVKVYAFDSNYRDNTVYPVNYGEATTFPFPENCLPIMARPCHNEWIDYTVDNAMENNDLFLYVGLPKNFEDDLCVVKEKYKITIEAFDAGEDGEKIVRIERNLT